MNRHMAGRLAPYLFLALLALFSLGTKLSTVQWGAPYVTIDDQSMYEAGFLVWFGQAPPQRMYLESWLSGLSSISTYLLRNPQEAAVGLDLVASAYSDFHANPDPYVLSYRLLALLMDLITALLVFFMGRALFREQRSRDWIAALAAGFYLLNARDDASPWLEWGDQFVTILRGTGWLVVPLLLGTVWYARRSDLWRRQPRLGSLLFMSLCWLLLFASIQVLRVHWMLPALLLFYLAAAYGLGQLRQQRLQWAATGMVVLVLTAQLWQVMHNFRSPPFNQLMALGTKPYRATRAFYVLGYLAVNTQAIQNQTRAIERHLASALEQGEPFTHRHIRL